MARGSSPVAERRLGLYVGAVALGAVLAVALAEGVEDEAGRDRLRGLGRDAAQGFLWSPAVPAADLLASVARLSTATLTEAI